MKPLLRLAEPLVDPAADQLHQLRVVALAVERLPGGLLHLGRAGRPIERDHHQLARC